MFTKLLSQHDDDECESYEGEEVCFEFFVSGSNSSELLDFIEQPFNFVALFIALLVVDDTIQTIGFWRNDGLDALGFQLLRMALLS